jgi:3-methyladenine DNA glycosylase AlkD
MIKQIEKDLKQYSNPKKAKNLQKFFKTNKGEYGYGDIFLGITVPEIRNIVRKYYKEVPIKDLLYFVQSKYHEYRLFGLLSLVSKFEKSKDEKKREEIYRTYISNTKYINNWDLVDLTSYKLVGSYLKDRKRDTLYTFAKSNDLWKQRISIISTYSFIRDNDFKDTLAISKILLNHEHDLIHKAVGWMLREVGKRDIGVEEKFLKKYYKDMPRTMLRYAIEKFEEDKRQKYLKGEI